MSGATKRFILTIAAVCLLPSVALAQSSRDWNPQRYLELVREGDRICENALMIPESDALAYQDAMFACLGSKEAALEMLRRAVLLQQVGQLDELWEEANRDLFNLTENVVVLYILLDQCIAADTIMSRALREPETLPVGGVGHLESLRPEIEDCSARVASGVGAPTFDEGRYSNLIQVAESWRTQAYARPANDVEGRSANLYEASQHYGEALGLLRQAIVDGILRGTEEQEELFLLYDELVTVLLEMKLCAGAQRRIRQAIADADEFPVGNAGQFEARQAEVQQCQRDLLAEAQTGQPAPRGREEHRVPDLPESSEVGYAPYILWGVAGAAAITALVLDITAGSDRDELDSLRDQCAAGPCDYGRTVDLADSLNGRKIAIGVLGGVAIVTAAVGTVLYFTNRGRTESAPAPGGRGDDRVQTGVPYFQWEGLGGSLNINF
jgi:hypothetical protein